MCEIDSMVIDVSKKYLPNMAARFNDPKLTLHIGDGHEFLKTHKNAFDVIITDSSDPVGPAESLFGASYYKLLYDSLTDDGIVSSQAESLWLHLDLIAHMMSFTRDIFPVVRYASASVPTYPSGCIGYLIAAKNQTTDVTTPVRKVTIDEWKLMKLRFYDSRVHSAAFVLPRFVTDAIAPQ